MGSQYQRGFTIIETMLFLAISGVLILAMVATTGVSINIQRYHDAVETFKATLQNQYDALNSVENDRTNQWSCTAGATTDEDGSEIRGQSECQLLGRLLTIEGGDISIYSILGRPKGNETTKSNDIKQLRDEYTLNVSTVNQDETVMEWDTQIAWPISGPEQHSPATPRSLALLFLRSPSSGQIYTFTSDTVLETPTSDMIKDMIVGDAAIPGRQYRTVCIDSNGVLVNDDQSIYITSYATGPSSIETQSNAVMANPATPRGEHDSQC